MLVRRDPSPPGMQVRTVHTHTLVHTEKLSVSAPSEGNCSLWKLILCGHNVYRKLSFTSSLERSLASASEEEPEGMQATPLIQQMRASSSPR